jgi:hypothetical protein
MILKQNVDYPTLAQSSDNTTYVLDLVQNKDHLLPQQQLPEGAEQTSRQCCRTVECDPLRSIVPPVQFNNSAD